MGIAKVGRFLKRYAIVIFFPTFTASTIYADWSYTQQWKRSQTLSQQ